MTEIISKRTENSKTYDLGGNKRQLVASIGSIHYKDNYADVAEQWKDIDLTIVDGKLTTAPYELVIGDKKITVKDKKTGDISTIELTSAKPSGLKFEIVPEHTRVSFRHILPSDKVPFEAKFRVTGKGLITTKAFDDDGELVLDTALVDGVLTEKISNVVDKQTGKVRPSRGNIRIDPTWQVAASTDDANRILGGDIWATDWTNLGAGAHTTFNRYGIGARFTNITIAQGDIVNQAYLTLTSKAPQSTNPVKTRLSADDTDNAVTFSTAINFDARWAARTTARIDWDSIGDWETDVAYNSPEIKTVIQEIVDRVGWVSGNAMVIFWDDFDNRTSNSAGYYREAYSYDGSTAKAPKLVITYTSQQTTTVTPSTLSLSTTAYAPIFGLGVIPSTAALTLTFYAPLGGEGVTPDTLSLTITSYAPSIVSPLWYPVDVDWNNDGDFTDTYDDITSDITSVRFSRGKSDELGKAEVGQCSITLNNATGKYTPGAGGVISASLLPKRPIRVRATLNGVTYPLFYGFIEEIIPHPHLNEQDCIITAVDGLDYLSRQELDTVLWKSSLSGAVIGNMLDAAGWSASKRSLDAGQDTIPYAYWRDVSARYALGEVESSEQGFVYIDGGGNFIFEDRHHRSTDTHQTSQATFTNTMANITYSMNPKNIYNIIRVTVTPWTLQGITELWRLSETPSIPSGATLTWWGDASVSGDSVFVDAWTTPVITTDYTANSLANGTGDDETANISIVTTKFAKTIKLEVTNNATHPVFITLLKARGTYYDDQTKVTRKAEDSTSQAAYQKRTLSLDGKFMTDADKAQDFCNYAIGKYKDPRGEVGMSALNKNASMLTQILSRQISDRITVVNTKLGLSKDFFIDYIEHDISLSGLSHTVTYRLADCINEDFWCWDYSLWDTQTKWGY